MDVLFNLKSRVAPKNSKLLSVVRSKQKLLRLLLLLKRFILLGKAKNSFRI